MFSHVRQRYIHHKQNCFAVGISRIISFTDRETSISFHAISFYKKDCFNLKHIIDTNAYLLYTIT